MMGTQDKQQLDVVTSHDRPVEKNYINSTLINRSFSPQVFNRDIILNYLYYSFAILFIYVLIDWSCKYHVIEIDCGNSHFFKKKGSCLVM